MLCKIEVVSGGESRILSAERGCVLGEALAKNGIYYDAPCGGNGKCGKCAAAVSGALSAPEAEELRALGGREGLRLLCRARVEGDCRVALPEGGSMRIGIDGRSAGFATERWSASELGAAVDIGTTTVVCYLYELGSGRLVGTAGELNRQRAFGADVISRIDRCIKSPDGLAEQCALIRGQIRRMLGTLAPNPEKIGALAVAGNTTMEHLFAGLDPSGLGKLPFTPQSLFGEEHKCNFARELGISPEAEIFLLPAVSGYVGGDITASTMVAGLGGGKETAVMLDVGTNGEMSLAHGGRIFCCATAAGPAFEGADISCGMGGEPGAIDTVSLEGGRLRCSVIGGGTARGVCGSGLIDALACMLELGAVDETGRLLYADEAEDAAAEYIGEDGGGDPVFKLADGICLTGKDVRRLQLAKAAIAAGIATLLDCAGICEANVEKLYVAGGFGNHINPRSAGRIGLYPRGLTDKSVSIGNAAGSGASAVLLSRSARREITLLRDRMEYIELSKDKRFMEHYVEEMMF